ncbi:hypothetical protein [Streptomyces hoynatensis]|uniref:hypothetical protein n=1 Tax=Streptomyces hoynatensis TaxID=1141874 RepID=UPI001319CCA9|nr:hypothetical protein [Streptomyces hoynatensis]
MTDNGGAAEERGAGRARRIRRTRRTLLSAAIVTAAMASMAAAAPTSAAESDGSAEVPRTAEETLDALTALLPSSLTYSEAEAEGVDTSEWPSAYLVAEDGSGGTSLQLSLNRWATDDWHDIAGCQGFGEPEEGFTCEQTELADGSILSFVTWDFGGPEDGGETLEWEAWVEGPGGSSLDQPGGRAVVLTEAHDLTDGEDPDTYQPLLDFEQLAAAVQAPVWQQVFDAVDAEYGAPSDGEDTPSADIPPAALRDTFRQVAPEGMQITDGEEEEPGYATLQVDDGQGPGLVDITVYGPEGEEPGDGADEAAEGELSSEVVSFAEEDVASAEEEGEDEGPQCEDSVLPDGTEVSACDWPPTGEDDPYDLAWVDVTYPDGTILSISALNAPDWETEPTRAAAPLGPEELQRIATDEAWRTLVLEG